MIGYYRAGVRKLFSVKCQIVNIVSFGSSTVAIATKLCHSSVKAAVENTETNQPDFSVSIKLYSQTRRWTPYYIAMNMNKL